MSRNLPAARPPDASHAVVHARRKASRFLQRSKAENTVRAYRSDWHDFTDWCAHAGREPLPASPDTVALYIATLAEGLRVSTIRRRLAAISKAHQYEGLATPTKDVIVTDVLDGIRREMGYLQKGKTPLLLPEIVAMLDAQDETLSGIRNRALLLVGFAGCLRRSELVGLDIRDCSFSEDGVVLLLRKSKTDQYGEGIQKAIPYGMNADTCPVRALKAWLSALGVSDGPVFRGVTRGQKIRDSRLTAQSVALVVKAALRKAGIDPREYSGHSLRSGFATQAAIFGVDERAIMEQGAWKSATMARRYIRDANLFRNNAAGQIGL